MSENWKPLDQLLIDLEEAKKRLLQVCEQKKVDFEAAAELEAKATARVHDAQNVYNGIAKKIDAELLRLHQGAPPGTAWAEELPT